MGSAMGWSVEQETELLHKMKKALAQSQVSK